METQSELARYADFSSDEWIKSAFNNRAVIDPKLADYAVEIQKYLDMKNPVQAIKGLVALQTATSAGFAIGSGRSATIRNVLLMVNTVILGYIGYNFS